MRVNFLEETKGRIEAFGHTIKDIQFITNYLSYMTWEEFEKQSDFEYENEYFDDDKQFIYEHIKIVGNGWWLERDMTDPRDMVSGKYYEFWSYNEIPKQPTKKEEFSVCKDDYSYDEE